MFKLSKLGLVKRGECFSAECTQGMQICGIMIETGLIFLQMTQDR